MAKFDRNAAINPDIEKQIIKTLDQIEKDHKVKILHAIESGSRAWGFHSPNSDYDVRFFYIHERDWYLSIYEGRDVIELPINEIYDVSGWDLKKALHLAMKSNAVVTEWLKSPIQYKTDGKFTLEFSEICKSLYNKKALYHHYINLGIRQIDQTWRTSETTKIKKYFYMLRPAFALRWMDQNDIDAQMIPMNIQELMEQSDVPETIKRLVNELIEKKKKLEEKAITQKIEELDAFVLEQYELAKLKTEQMPKVTSEKPSKADAFFRRWVS